MMYVDEDAYYKIIMGSFDDIVLTSCCFGIDELHLSEILLDKYFANMFSLN